jgi:hypothetical protein
LEEGMKVLVEYAEGAGADPRGHRVDCGKLARALPEFAIKWMARELRDAFEQVRLTAEEFQGDRYTRLARVRLLSAGARFDGDHRGMDAPRVEVTA